jgi:hypothetical protein
MGRKLTSCDPNPCLSSRLFLSIALILVCPLLSAVKYLEHSFVRPDFCQMSPNCFFRASAQCLMASDTEGLLHFLSCSFLILHFSVPIRVWNKPFLDCPLTCPIYEQDISKMTVSHFPPCSYHGPATFPLPRLLTQPLDSCSCFCFTFQ